jgi:hypothetical protein
MTPPLKMSARIADDGAGEPDDVTMKLTVEPGSPDTTVCWNADVPTLPFCLLRQFEKAFQLVGAFIARVAPTVE